MFLGNGGKHSYGYPLFLQVLQLRSAFGASVLDYWNGDSSAKHVIERDDGYREEGHVEYLFREVSNWPREEVQA